MQIGRFWEYKACGTGNFLKHCIKKSLSSPHLKRCGLCGTSGCKKIPNGIFGTENCNSRAIFKCSEKDSFKETVSSLKAGVYFSDIKDSQIDI
jgi:hypothetical protein